MNVLLINPSYSRTDALGPFAGYISAQLPLSLGFLAGYLRQQGAGVEILDEQLGRITGELLDRAIEGRRVTLIGITVLTLTSGRAYEIGSYLRKRWPQVPVVMGGVHVTLLPGEPLASGAADVVVRGEGELTLHELATRISGGRPYHDVAGISFNDGSAAVHNADRPLIEDLDTLPPFPYDLFEQDRTRYQFGNVLASRGCPYECIFCSQRAISGRRYRTRSPQLVFRDIEALVYSYGQDYVFLNDDNFLVNKDAVRRLCDLLIERGVPGRARIGFNSRADALDEELLNHMRRAGFGVVLIGFETGSERIMRMIKKGETLQQITDGVAAARRCGFLIGGQFILGFPTETRRESLQTVLHALRLPVDSVRFNLLVPYPGTEVYDLAVREGGRKSEDWSEYATHGGLTGAAAPYVPAGRSRRELVWLQRLGHLLFYFRPRQLARLGNLKYATGGQLAIPMPTSVRGVLAFCRFLLLFMLFPFSGRRRSSGKADRPL